MNLSLLRNLFLALTIYTNLLSWSKPVHEKWKFIVVLPFAVHIIKDAPKFEKKQEIVVKFTLQLVFPLARNPTTLITF